MAQRVLLAWMVLFLAGLVATVFVAPIAQLFDLIGRSLP